MKLNEHDLRTLGLINDIFFYLNVQILTLPTYKAFPTYRESEVVFSTKTMSLGAFFEKKHLVLKTRNIDNEVFFRQVPSEVDVTTRRVLK